MSEATHSLSKYMYPTYHDIPSSVTKNLDLYVDFVVYPNFVKQPEVGDSKTKSSILLRVPKHKNCSRVHYNYDNYIHGVKPLATTSLSNDKSLNSVNTSLTSTKGFIGTFSENQRSRRFTVSIMIGVSSTLNTFSYGYIMNWKRLLIFCDHKKSQWEMNKSDRNPSPSTLKIHPCHLYHCE